MLQIRVFNSVSSKLTASGRPEPIAIFAKSQSATQGLAHQDTTLFKSHEPVLASRASLVRAVNTKRIISRILRHNDGEFNWSIASYRSDAISTKTLTSRILIPESHLPYHSSQHRLSPSGYHRQTEIMKFSLLFSLTLLTFGLLANSQTTYPGCVNDSCGALRTAALSSCGYDFGLSANANATQTLCICSLSNIQAIFPPCVPYINSPHQ